jgi:hypothetical protein
VAEQFWFLSQNMTFDLCEWLGNSASSHCYRCPILTETGMSRQTLVTFTITVTYNYQISNFVKIRSAVYELSHSYIRADGHSHLNKGSVGMITN